MIDKLDLIEALSRAESQEDFRAIARELKQNWGLSAECRVMESPVRNRGVQDSEA